MSSNMNYRTGAETGFTFIGPWSKTDYFNLLQSNEGWHNLANHLAPWLEELDRCIFLPDGDADEVFGDAWDILVEAASLQILTAIKKKPRVRGIVANWPRPKSFCVPGNYDQAKGFNITWEV